MNDVVDSANQTGFFSSLASSFDPGLSQNQQESTVQVSEFIDVLSGQEQLSGLLSQLRELLPAEEFASVAALLGGGGNPLPLTAEVAGELPATLNPEVVQALFARLGLASGALSRPGSAGSAAAVAVKAGRSTLAGLGQRLSDGLFASSDGRLEGATESAIKDTGLMLDPASRPLPPGLGMDLLPVELPQPLVGMLPKSVASSLIASELDTSPLVEVNMISGVMGRVSPETAIAPRAFGQPMLELNAPLGKSGWEQGLGERVLWLVGHSIQGASMRINPPHLGPIDIQLTLQNDQASVSFSAQHGVVREALEAAIPRLREMFGENNLQLANVDVGQRDSGDTRPHAEHADRNPDSGREALAESRERGEDGLEQEGTLAADSMRYYRSDGLLDDYA